MNYLKLISLAAIFSVNVAVAEVFVNDKHLELTGVISNDEFSRFKTLFDSVLTRNDFGINNLNSLELQNVKGGSLSEAVKIADFVRSMRLRVNLTGECSSACVLIYFASVQRKYDRGASLGVHRIRFARNGLKDMSLDEATQNYQAGEQLLISKLTEYGAPQSIIEQLKGTSSRDLTIIPIGLVPVFPNVVYEWLQDSCDEFPLKHIEIGNNAFNSLEQAYSQGLVSNDTPAASIAEWLNSSVKKQTQPLPSKAIAEQKVASGIRCMANTLQRKKHIARITACHAELCSKESRETAKVHLGLIIKRADCPFLLTEKNLVT